MAEIGHSLLKYETNVDQTGTTWKEDANHKMPASDFEAGETYFVRICAMTGSTTSNNSLDEFEVEAVGASIAASKSIHESRRSGGAQGHQFYWIGEVTMGSPASDIQFRFRASAAGQTARVKCIYGVALKTSDLGASNYKFASLVPSPSGDAPNSLTDGAEITLPDDTSQWYVFASSHWTADEVGSDMEMLLDFAGTDGDSVILETENTSEEYTFGYERAVVNGSGGKTFKVEYKAENASTHDCDYTAIGAINMDAFLVGFAEEDTSDTSISSAATWTTLSEFLDKIVGDGTRNYCVLGGSLMDVAESAKRHESGIEYQRGSGGWNTAAGMDDADELVGHGNGDQHGMYYAAELTDIADTESIDFRLRGREHSDVTPAPVAILGSICCFSWELAASGPIDDSISEDLALTGAFGIEVTVDESISGALALSESASMVATVAEAISEALTLEDTIAAQATIGESITEALGVGDSMGSGGSVDESMTGDVQLDVTVAAIATAFGSIAEALELGEAWAAEAILAVDLDGDLELADTFAIEQLLEDAIAEDLELAATFGEAVNVLASLSEDISFGETVAAVVTVAASIGESVTLGATISELVTVLEDLSGTLELGDTFGIEQIVEDSIDGELAQTGVFSILATIAGSILADVDLSDVIAASATISESISGDLEFGATFAPTVTAGSVPVAIGAISVAAAVTGAVAAQSATDATSLEADPATLGELDTETGTEGTIANDSSTDGSVISEYE